MFKEEFIKSANNFYEARKILTKEEKKLLKLKKPLWTYSRANKELAKVYKDQKILYPEGRIALGTIVQANEMLFQPGPMDLPAVFLYSEDEYFLDNPEELRKIAGSLYELKGKEDVDLEVKEFVDTITDEYKTLLNKKLPYSITNGRDVYYTTIVVTRMHLPNIYIDRHFYPMLVCPEKCNSSIILCSLYWTAEYEEVTEVHE